MRYGNEIEQERVHFHWRHSPAVLLRDPEQVDTAHRHVAHFVFRNRTVHKQNMSSFIGRVSIARIRDRALWTVTTSDCARCRPSQRRIRRVCEAPVD